MASTGAADDEVNRMPQAGIGGRRLCLLLYRFSPRLDRSTGETARAVALHPMRGVGYARRRMSDLSAHTPPSEYFWCSGTGTRMTDGHPHNAVACAAAIATVRIRRRFGGRIVKLSIRRFFLF